MNKSKLIYKFITNKEWNNFIHKNGLGLLLKNPEPNFLGFIRNFYEHRNLHIDLKSNECYFVHQILEVQKNNFKDKNPMLICIEPNNHPISAILCNGMDFMPVLESNSLPINIQEHLNGVPNIKFIRQISSVDLFKPN
jgi:hypothetical protein